MATLDSDVPNVSDSESDSHSVSDSDSDSESSSSAPPSPSSSKKPKRVQIIELNPVALWSWIPELDIECDICTNHIMNPCAQCESSGTSEKCIYVKGVCTHTFHDHCISTWLENKEGKVCPFDNKKWDIEKVGH